MRSHKAGLVGTGRKGFPFLNFSPDPVVLINEAGIVAWANTLAEELFSLPAQEICGEHVSTFLIGIHSALFPFEQSAFFRNPVHHKVGRQKNLFIKRSAGSALAVEVSFNGFVHEGQQFTWASIHELAEESEGLLDGGAYAQSLIEVSNEPFVIIKLNGDVHEANDAFCKLTHQQRVGVVGTSFADLFLEPEKATEALRKVADRSMITNIPLAIKSANNSRRDVSLNAFLYQDESGNAQAIAVSLRDLSSSPRPTQYARTLLDTSLDLQITIDGDGRITDVNEAAAEVTGLNREKLIGTHFPDYCTEPRKAEEAYHQAFYKGVVRNYPLSVRHTSGKITDVLYNATAYKDDEGMVRGVFASARDVTDRKQAEEEIKRQQAYTRSLIEASLDPLVTISPDGKITDVNEASVRATGVSRWNLIGTDFSDYFTEPEKAREGYRQVFAQGFVADYPLTIRHNLRKVLYNASVYRDNSGRVLGVFAAARDITAQSKQEVRIQKLNEELEQRIIELESFSYSVSHDLRAPLRGIDGFIAIFLTRYLDKVDEEGQRLLNNVRRNVNKMGSLIDELLTLSRIGMKDIVITNIDMYELVNTVLDELHESKGKTRVVIKPLVPAQGDVALIKQVLVNLISNAFKYSAKKDKPTVEIGCYPDEGETQYYIRDNGVGFDMEYSNKLFGVFQRLHDPQEYQGTGVGLAIVKRIINRHSGSVWAVGKENEGATFYFSLKSLH